MPKSKNKKDQKKRSRARTQSIRSSKDKIQKAQREMIMEMIRKEQSKGVFNDLPSIDQPDEINLDGPSI